MLCQAAKNARLSTFVYQGNMAVITRPIPARLPPSHILPRRWRRRYGVRALLPWPAHYARASAGSGPGGAVSVSPLALPALPPSLSYYAAARRMDQTGLKGPR